jgi:hypothetical protein
MITVAELIRYRFEHDNESVTGIGIEYPSQLQPGS